VPYRLLSKQEKE